MEQKDIDCFRESLNHRLKELLKYAYDIVYCMTRQSEKLPDPSDRATLEADRYT